MGKFFSDAVEQALQYIYYDNRLGVRRGDLPLPSEGPGGAPPAPAAHIVMRGMRA